MFALPLIYLYTPLMSADECLFCSIVSKTEPASILLELEDFIVIQNKYPKAPVHLLILDKKHNEKFDTISGGNVDPLYWGKVMSAVSQALKLVGLEKTGDYELVCNGPSYAHFQHQHIHILGKYSDSVGART